MRILKVIDPDVFDRIPEDGMDFHIAAAETDGTSAFVVIGGRVAIPLDEANSEPMDDYLGQSWLRPGLSREDREEHFDG